MGCVCGRRSPRHTCKLIHASDQPSKMVPDLSPQGPEVSLPGAPRHSCDNPRVPSSLAGSGQGVRLRMEIWLNT